MAIIPEIQVVPVRAIEKLEGATCLVVSGSALSLPVLLPSC